MSIHRQFPITFWRTILLPFTDNFQRSDGSLDGGWIYATGRWTISSGTVVADPTLGPELITNGSMESGDPPSNWTALNGATLSATADERTGGSGTNSMDVIRGSSNSVAEQSVSSSFNEFIRAEIWAKKITGTSVILLKVFGSWTGTQTTWGLLRTTAKNNGPSPKMELQIVGSAGNSARFDDASMKVVTFTELFAVRDFGTPQVYIEAGITQPYSDALGLVVALDNANNPQNFVILHTLGTAWRLDKVVGGVWTNLATFNTATDRIAQPAGGTIALDFANGIIRCYWQDIQIGQDYRLTDAGILNNTKAGMFNTHPDNTIDNFSALASNEISLNGSLTNKFNVVTTAADLWTSSGSDDWLGRPVLANDGTKWIAVYRSGPDHTTGGRFHIRFSTDEGTTWTDEDVYTDSNPVTGAPFIDHGTNTDCGDAILFVAPNGNLIVQIGERTDGTYQYRSIDGGASWTDEGKILSDATLFGGQDYTIIDSDIYVTMMKGSVAGSNNFPWSVVLLKSSDNAATWTTQGTIITTDGNEMGVTHTTGNNMIAIMREWNVENTTYLFTSTDLGATWSSPISLPALGKFERPRLHKLAGGIMMVGRDQISTFDKTVVFYSDDNGISWGRKFYPDLGLFTDCGYCDVLQKTNGDFYLLTYGGSTAAAVVRRVVFGIS